MKQKTGRKLLGFLLTLAMVVGLMPGMSLTALAEGTTYNPASAYTDYAALNSSNTVVTIEEVANVEWYVIGYDSEAKTVTLLSKTSFGNKAFNSDQSKGHSYANSEIKTFVEGLTDDGQPLAEIKDALANISVTGNPSISGSVPYLLSTAEADKLDDTKKGSDVWWLRSPGYNDDSAAFVYDGDVDDEYGALVDLKLAVRPALQLNLESVIFDSESKTFSLKPVSKDPVSYMAWDETEKKLVEKTGDDACTDYTVVTDSTKDWTTGWYVVDSDVITISDRIEVTGTVNLILKDGAKLTAQKGINVETVNTLNIYAQSAGTGKLEATGVDARNSGIGGNGNDHTKDSGGTITINGGIINATGGKWAAGIGCGGFNKSLLGGTITINGGTVNATGGDNGAGIGGGDAAQGAVVTINGGIVNANGYGGAGIGGGYRGDGNSVTINGGTVTAMSNNNSVNRSGNGIGGGNDGGMYTIYMGKIAVASGLAVKMGDNEENASDTQYSNWYQYEPRYVHIYTPPHSHSFTYEATGATITATCPVNNCPLPEVNGKHAVTLGIEAPAMTIYGEVGKSAEATLTGLDNFNASTELNVATTDIRYVGRDGTSYEESLTAPIGAGKYTAKITVEEKTASVDYEIAQATTTITVNPTASDITYGQTLADSTLTGGTGSVAGGFAWKDSTVAPAVSDSQNTEYDVVFTPTDENYGAAKCKVKLTVNKADSAVTTPPTAKTLTYNGSAQSLINAGTASGGTMKYAVATANQEPAAEAYTFDNTSLPTATNAGTYYVWYKVVGNENYNDSKPDVVTVTIKPSVTVTFDSNGGSEVDPQVIDKGGKAEEPEEPTNGKLAFIGWFIDPTIENLYDFDNEKISSFNFYSAIDEDTTLTAVWAAFARVNTIGTGKVNYAYEGEEKDDEYDDSIILSAIQGMADTFILTAKADEGSRFVKWQKVIEEGETVEDSTFEDYSEDEEITIKITEPISLVAVFETIDEDDKVYSSYESDTEWTMGSGKSLKVGAKGSKDDEETINHFTGIKCNGKEIAKKYYTAKKGSVIIEIDPEYLETLEAGKHVLTLMFDDADDLDIEFTVLAAEEDDSKDDTSKDAKIDVDTDTADTGKTTGSNTDSSTQTGDNTQILLVLFIMIDSALALNYLMIKKRKSRKN